jgi:hypothetical protein
VLDAVAPHGFDRLSEDQPSAGFVGLVGGIAFIVAMVGGLAAPLLQILGVGSPLHILDRRWIYAAGLVLAVCDLPATMYVQLDTGDS